MLCYMLCHEAHHRGQVCMLAHQLGFPLPNKVKSGMWNWEKLWKECGSPDGPARFLSNRSSERIARAQAAPGMGCDGGDGEAYNFSGFGNGTQCRATHNSNPKITTGIMASIT